MFGFGSGVNGSPSSEGNMGDLSPLEYTNMARGAQDRGEDLLAAHLYVAAFEKGVTSTTGSDAEIVDGLRKALDLAYEQKQRSLMEYIFERLEPFSTGDEIQNNAQRLQKLAMEKLEDFGFSHEDMQEMANVLSNDALGASLVAHLKEATGMLDDADASGASDGKASGDAPSTGGVPAMMGKGSDSDEIGIFGFDDLVGYDGAIETMHRVGIGLGKDEHFNDFLKSLSKSFGISTLPSVQTMVFRSAAREDATHFMGAVVGEMKLPTVRMYMEEGPTGMMMLCVTASPEFKSRAHFIRNGFDMPAVLMLEDVDLWGLPLASQTGGIDMAQMSQLAHGAREAFMFVRSAVNNPNVTVMASCESGTGEDELFHGLLDPCGFVDIDLPTEDERAAIWLHVGELYPSLRCIDRDELVRLSATLSRFDIYMAARDAVEQAYRESVKRREFVPVTNESLFSSIAAYLPLDSKGYQDIEDLMVEGFGRELDDIDDLLKGEDL